MINIMYAVDPIKRIVKPMSGHAVTEQDHEASSLRFAFPDNIAGTGLDSTGTAVRVMYVRPDGGDPVAKTLTFYKHSGGYYLYDWNLQKSDLQKEGRLVFSLCILNIVEGEVSEWHTTPCQIRVLDTIHTDDSDEGDETITPTVAQRVAVLETIIQRVASGAPIVVSSTSAMTDTDQIYVLSTDGMWYYYDGSAWVAGGEYGGVAAGSITTDKLADGAVTAEKIASGVIPAVDTTLTQSGIAADAKKTGDEISELKADLTLSNTALFGDVDDTFPLSFENGTYYATTTGSTLTKYYGGGYDKTRKVVKSTVFNAPCNVSVKAKTGYSFTVFTSNDGIITGTSNLITEYTMISGNQYGMTLCATGGTDDISAVAVSSIIDIEYISNVEELKADVDNIVGKGTIWEDINSPTKIENYRIATSGNTYEDSTGSILYWNIPVTGTYKFKISTTSNTYWGVYAVPIESTSDIVGSNRVTGGSGGSTRTYYLKAGQSVAVSARSTSFTGQGEKQETLVKLVDNLGLTGEMESQVDIKIRESNQTETYYGLSTDSNFYVDKVPSYYIDPPDTIESFDDVYGYLDNKIASIPKEGKHFIFITDTHWDGNKKHSPDLIAYIRERTGINKVLFGGDAFGNAATKYLAAQKANGYLLPSKRSCGYELICCVGDHDNNTVNVDKDASHFLPYSEVEKLFVGDIEGSPSYHWYDCREKLANFATVGSDDYNEALAFFHTVYYVDDGTQRIRYIVLNCGNGGNYGAMYNIFGGSGTELLRLQFDWLAETLMTTPSGWDIVVLSHKGNTNYAGVGGDTLNNILYSFRTKLANASGAPSSSTPAIESWWPHNWAYNFGSAPDIRFLITVNGHEHKDRLAYWGKTNGTYSKDETTISSGSTINQVNGTADNQQIPIIITNCDSLGVAEESSPSMTAGTVTEQCFDVITITDTGLVLTRIGAGDDRSLTITRNVT